MSSLRGTEHGFSLNFPLCRELVLTDKKGMLVVGSLLALESSTCWYIGFIKNCLFCLSRRQYGNSCYNT